MTSETALEALIRMVAEEQAAATRAANNAVIAEILQLLRNKGTVSTGEISALLADLESLVDATSERTPAMSRAVAESTSLLRQALGVTGGAQ